MTIASRFKVTINEKGRDRYVYIDKTSFIIGRGHDADVLIRSNLISRQQIRVTLVGESIWVEDLGSSNGTWLDDNRLPVKEKFTYRPGQRLALGSKSDSVLNLEYLTEEMPVEPEAEEMAKTSASLHVPKEISQVIHEEKVIQMQPARLLAVAELRNEAHTQNAVSLPLQKVANGPDVMAVPLPEARRVVMPVAPVQVPMPPVQPIQERSQTQTSAPVRTPPPAPVYEAPAPIKRRDHIVSEKVIQTKMSGEKNLFDQIKNLVELEAEEVRTAALEEAKATQRNAEKAAGQIIEKALDEATQKLRAVEPVIAKKMMDLQHAEYESEKKIENLKNTQGLVAKTIEELRQSEELYKQNLNQIKENIKKEEAHIQNEHSRLEAVKLELHEAKKRFELQSEEFQLEERRIRSRLETETLEARLKTNQIFAEAENAQKLKDVLVPEVTVLKSDKSRLENELNELSLERRRQEYALEKMTSDYQKASLELTEARRNQEVILAELEEQKRKHASYEAELLARDVETKENLQKSQEFADEKRAKAISASEKIMEEAEAHSKKLLEHAQSDFQNIEASILSARAEYERLITQNKEEVATLRAQAERETYELKSRTEEELTSFKAAVTVEVEALRRSAKLEVDALKEKTQQEAGALKARTEDDVQRLKTSAQNEAEALTLAAKDEAARLRLESKTYYDEAKAKSDVMLDQLKNEIQKKKKESLQYITQLEEKKKVIESELANLEQTRKERLSDATSAIEDLLSRAESEAREIRAKAERETSESRSKTEKEILENAKRQNQLIDEELASKRQEVKSIVEGAKLEAREIALKAENEALSNRKKQENALTEYKHIEMHKIKEMRLKAEDDIAQKKNERAKIVATNLYALVTSEMYKAKNKVLDDVLIDAFTKELKELVVDTMLDRIGTDTDRLQSILKTSENAKSKERDYWRRNLIIGGSVVLAILLLVIFPGIITGPKNAIVASFTDRGPAKQDQFLAKVQEARLKAIYNPETTPEFKVTYADNVLFTTDFLTKRQDAAFQDRWILELNDYFIKRLDVKDTTTIKFISLESAFLKDMAKLKKDVDPKNPDPGIEALRVREDEFKLKLGEIFENHGKVSNFYEFHEKFWDTYFNPRVRSNQPEETP